MGCDKLADCLRCIVGHLCNSDVVLFSRHSIRSSNSSSVTKYESRIEAALSALQQQQALSNSALYAIRSELRDLNEKAGKAADLAPPE